MAARRDAEMNSSPTSSFDADEEADLFPESNTNLSNLPVQNDHLNASAPGELSPPRSQGSEEDTATTHTRHPDTNGHPAMVYHEEKVSNVHEDGRGQEPAKPGSGWNNKRANEEYQRAWDTVLDKDFNLREFGDVMEIVEQQPQRKS